MYLHHMTNTNFPTGNSFVKLFTLSILFMWLNRISSYMGQSIRKKIFHLLFRPRKGTFSFFFKTTTKCERPSNSTFKQVSHTKAAGLRRRRPYNIRWSLAVPRFLVPKPVVALIKHYCWDKNTLHGLKRLWFGISSRQGQ